MGMDILTMVNGQTLFSASVVMDIMVDNDRYWLQRYLAWPQKQDLLNPSLHELYIVFKQIDDRELGEKHGDNGKQFPRRASEGSQGFPSRLFREKASGLGHQTTHCLIGSNSSHHEGVNH